MGVGFRHFLQSNKHPFVGVKWIGVIRKQIGIGINESEYFKTVFLFFLTKGIFKTVFLFILIK